MVHISLGRVIFTDAAGNLLSELQQLLKPLLDLRLECNHPIRAAVWDSVLTITADKEELSKLERLARKYLRL